MNPKGLILWVSIALLLVSWAVLYAQQAPPPPPQPRRSNLLAICNDARDQRAIQHQLVSQARIKLESDMAATSLALLKSRDEVKGLVSRISKMEFEQKQKEKEAETEVAEPETEVAKPETKEPKPGTVTQEPTQ